MTQNFVNILNAPLVTSGDLVESGGSVKITGLSPYKLNLVNSCTLQRSTVEALQVWSVAMTAVSGSVYSFSIEQIVNGMRSLKVFSYEATSTTGSEIVSAIDGFFGATGNSSTYTTATWGSVMYKVTSSSASVTLTISQVSGEAFPTVANASNTTVTNGMGTVVTVASGANTSGQPIIFKKVGHGLVSGQLLLVPTLTGQTAANGLVGRVNVVDADNFNLSSTQTGTFFLAGSTTATGAGTLTLVATSAFGTAAFVNADASRNNSTQTATVTANNYSLVTIESGSNGGELPNLSTRTAPIHLWVSEDANGLTLLGTITTSYLA
jgi:hypothetical protein